MTYYPEFSRLLNQALQRQDRSASWLAQRLGISPSTVGRWLNDGTRPGSPELVAKISDTLGNEADVQALLSATGYGYTLTDADSDSETTPRPSKATPIVQSPLSKLPLPATPIVGRQYEQNQLAAWFENPTIRLVTIVGPGGMGKTRLALAAAQAQRDLGTFKHGVAFVDLAPLSKADQMPVAIVQALGIPLDNSGEQVRSIEQQIVDFLYQRHLLMVLDNAEHLPGGVDLIARIVRSANQIQVLVTSRVPLRLPEEQLYPLHGLDYTKGSTHGDDRDPGAAMALFLQAARRIRPSYEYSSAERAKIIDICDLVEGLPLAIELAASWVSLMSAADIFEAIGESLDFLETDLHGVPARHRSMEAVFDATWHQLDEVDRETFAALSTFRGGFTADAVKAVTGSTVVQLRRLASNSLIVYDNQRRRYAIHELLRQYGAKRLAEAPDTAQTANERHSVFYLELLYKRQNALKSRALQTDLQVLDAEIDNLSQAWQWAAEQGQVDGISRTLDGFGLYLQWRGLAFAGEGAFQSASAALRDERDRRPYIRSMAWQSLFARTLGRVEDAYAILHDCLLLLEPVSTQESAGQKTVTLDTESERAFVLMQLGALEAGRNTDAADKHYRESLALFKTTGEPWFAAEVLLGLGHVSLIQGDFDQQRQCVQRALDTYRTLGNVRGTASALSMLADIDSYRGRLMSGLELGYEALNSFRSMGDTMGTATSLSRISMTYMNLGDIENARSMTHDSLSLFTEIGSRRDQVIAYAFLCAMDLMEGDYVSAQTNAERSCAIADTLDDQFVRGVAIGFLGWAQLYNGETQHALSTLRHAVTITTDSGATMDMVRWYSQLGHGEWRAGQATQARYHCYRAVQLAAEVVDPWSLLTAIGSAVAILADGENPALAVKLHFMLMQEPLCTASRWYADGIAPYVEAASKQLSRAQLESAIEQGSALKQQEAIISLRDELATLGWHG